MDNLNRARFNEEIAMKKLIPLTISLSIIISFGVTISTKNVDPHLTNASSYTNNSVPTNLDLNDVDEEDIRSYYSSLNLLDEEERTGTNLLKNLKPILKNNQTYFSYGSSATTAIWQAYEIVDRDWDKSPAEEIDGYDPLTNTITGYIYGSSVGSNQGSNPYIHALYVNRDKENGTKAWSDHTQTNYGFNQEHIWAKSCGFDNNSPSTGARGDLMHLWAGNGRVNGQYHSNYYYGYVDTTRSYSNAGNDYSYLDGNLKGYSKTLGGNVYVFEPQDSDKGDIARALFYMVARYNYLSGNDEEGIDAGNPNLELVNELSSWSSSGYQSSSTSTGKMGLISDLLEWNKIDPPDEWEIHRNNLCYNNFTNNRNPFIDFPEWAEYIWGDKIGTNFANPMTDDVTEIAPFKIKDNNGKTFNGKIELGKEVTLKVDADSGTQIKWSIADETVASIAKTNNTNVSNRISALNGIVLDIDSTDTVTIKGEKEGTTILTITATIDGEEKNANINIVVAEKAVNPSEQTLLELDSKTLLIIGAAAVIIIIIVLILFMIFGSKKAKKKAKKVVKNAVKNSKSKKRK